MYSHSGGDSALKLFVFPKAAVEKAKRIVDRITNSLKTAVLKLDKADIEISMSVGFCELTDEKNTDEMINKADKMMYENIKNELSIYRFGGERRL